MTDEPKQWGGRRRGAGRPLSGDAPLQRTGYPVRLTADQLEYVRSNGGAELIRRLINEHMKRERSESDGNDNFMDQSDLESNHGL